MDSIGSDCPGATVSFGRPAFVRIRGMFKPRRLILLGLVGGVAAWFWRFKRSGTSASPAPLAAGTPDPFPFRPIERPGAAPVATATPAATDDATWIPAEGGTCPLSHPVKANGSSKIFHVPGGLSYERTRADRCYRSPADAEADGYRAAKR
jgi:hypothetical protein